MYHLAPTLCPGGHLRLHPCGCQRCWPLRADARAAADARALVRGQLTEWGLAAQSDLAQLLVSELVGNAVQHAGGPCRLRLVRRAGLLRCEVEDCSGAPPVPRTAGAGEEGGRGMGLVDLLATRWGSRLTPSGKAVWFELELPAGRWHLPGASAHPRARRLAAGLPHRFLP